MFGDGYDVTYLTNMAAVSYNTNNTNGLLYI